MSDSPGTPTRGRPRASSRAVLEEAAYELFLEQGYDGTTVAEIARRAGVSRGTFFNYFPTKADVFWGDIDEALDSLPDALREAATAVAADRDGADRDAAIRTALTQALLRVAGGFGPDRVPWILTQYETMGRPAEVGVSVLARMGRATEILTAFIGQARGDSARSLASRSLAYTTLAGVFAAAQQWAEAGPARGALGDRLAEALGDPAAAGAAQ